MENAFHEPIEAWPLKEKALQMLKDKGYKGAEVEFEMGNDEGGASLPTLIAQDGTRSEGGEEWWDSALQDAVYHIIPYNAFPGHAYGTVIFNVEEGTVKMKGSITEPVPLTREL